MYRIFHLFTSLLFLCGLLAVSHNNILPTSQFEENVLLKFYFTGYQVNILLKFTSRVPSQYFITYRNRGQHHAKLCITQYELININDIISLETILFNLMQKFYHGAS